MKNIFVLIFLLSFTSILSQEEINQYNTNGQKTGIWKKYYANKSIRYQGEFKNGKEVGVFKFYSNNSAKHPIAIKSYLENTDSISVQFFTEEGLLQSEGKMLGKLRVGEWKYYNIKNESIISIENYYNGKLNGEVKTFYKNGKLAELLTYKNGILHGVSKRFSSEGILLELFTYENGILNGEAAFYNTNGDLIMSGLYKNGEKFGNWKVENYQRD